MELREMNVLRGRVKKCLTDFEKYILSIDRTNEITSQMQIKIKMRLDTVIPKHEEFTKIHYQICEKLEKEDDEELDAFENAYFEVVSLAKDILNDAEKKESVSYDTESVVSSQNPDHTAAHVEPNVNAHARVQLPNLTLPSFNGKPELWLDFRDMFQALIHEDANLNDTKKLYYLRGALEGDAKLVLQGVKTSAENYQSAWECLCERYENRRLLINNHLNAIHGIKPIKQECPKQLRELLDNINLNLRALGNLQQPVETWDTLIIFLLCKKLDPASVREWEAKQNKDIVQDLDEFKAFIRNRADMLDSLNPKFENKQQVPEKTFKPKFDKAFTVSDIPQQPVKCYYCHEQHAIYYCAKFKTLDIEMRIQKVAELKLCPNCLKLGHQVRNCTRSGCIKCKCKHNSLLHKAAQRENVSTPSAPRQQDTPQINASYHASTNHNGSTRVLLSTAMADVHSQQGDLQSCRLLLDNGSQMNLISTETVRRLGVQVKPYLMPIGGIGNSCTQVKGSCEVTIKSKISNFQCTLQCLVLPEISTNLPQFNINLQMIKIPSTIELADPTFASSEPIHILIGAGEFFNFFTDGIIKLGKDLPALVNTEFGWIVSGTVPTDQGASIDKCYHTQEIHDTLMKFWEVEDIPSGKPLSEQESFAEDHFLKHTIRNADGRFVVSIPFKDDISKLGNSEEGAQRRFLSVERRLERNFELKLKYTEFMQEYIDLEHMSILSNRDSKALYYFLPHHSVFNESSLTTKVRVVFDGSFASSSGISRNQIECVGPIVQSDLISILLRFRCYKIAISADITKMYRQILIKPSDRKMQNILWRNKPSDPLSIYQLNTVTYGTASASFLATRCLLEISKSFEKVDPKLSDVIREDFYVDDVLTGVDSIAEGKSLCSKLKNALFSYGLPLQKWNSNVPMILNDVRTQDGSVNVSLSQGETSKTLGLFWNPIKDNFHYSISSNSSREVTKRSILSSISQIFDPLGLVGASVIIPKMLLQSLWELKLDWDEPVPTNIASKWVSFEEEISELNSIKIPRCIIPEGATNLEIHGFADASERAYGACIYMRCDTEHGTQTSLICAKSKVAPIKTLTVPRLELCAALILSKLISKVMSSLRCKVDDVFLWTDSEIVICWLKKPPNLLKMFVANRVTKVQSITKEYSWLYVPSRDNPADLISRGLMPSDILNSSLWWTGPTWLKQERSNWPYQKQNSMFIVPELRKIFDKSFICFQACPIDFSRFSNYKRLLHTMAYVMRFCQICKGLLHRPISMTILPEELSHSLHIIIRYVQHLSFSDEIRQLIAKGQVKNSSPLAPLIPYIDERDILRVSGRLQNSCLDADAKHPIILPHKHIFTKLLFKYEHARLGHAGPQLLLCSVRQRYWPLHGKALARKTLHECVRCFKAKPKNISPRMAPLPAQRVNPSPPFMVTGVDYAGPISIKAKAGRGVKSLKCYISLFICFSTKAIHVEVVSDLTTEAFIAAFRRFSARRGSPSIVWSDNGTNFVGANNELKRIILSLTSDESIIEAFSFANIKWNFIPSNSPHFGGLWESGVRGVKHHLRRVIGNQILTFEELNTVCCQIEAIVNSRPLTILSEDPSDPSPLTPSHFLVGRSLTSIPAEIVEDVAINRLSRFQLLQQMTQHFWRRWSNEYLHTLQSTPKWRSKEAGLKVNDIVLIQSDHSHPMSWPLGRITETFPGQDGIIRVASVSTKNGTIRRAAQKLYRLPSSL